MLCKHGSAIDKTAVCYQHCESQVCPLQVGLLAAGAEWHELL